jgi:glycosyltransferase involved in cell wall biosynthesis
MVIGALRVKSEARWISRVIKSIQPICEKIVVFDDHSEDGTPEICESLGCVVIRSTFDNSINEVRDKNELLKAIWSAGAKLNDLVLMIDGDEILNLGDLSVLQEVIAGKRGFGNCWSFQIIYLWDREDQVRVDRWYSKFHRPSMFRLTRTDLSFRANGNGGNFHCGSVPSQLMGNYQVVPIRLLHLGYLYKEDRIKKYYWYNEQKPVPLNENNYYHMVVGDLFPADSVFVHAGPLELKPLQEWIPGAVL